jgi:hypothetical protein
MGDLLSSPQYMHVVKKAQDIGRRFEELGTGKKQQQQPNLYSADKLPISLLKLREVALKSMQRRRGKVLGNVRP